MQLSLPPPTKSEVVECSGLACILFEDLMAVAKRVVALSPAMSKEAAVVLSHVSTLSMIMDTVVAAVEEDKRPSNEDIDSEIEFLRGVVRGDHGPRPGSKIKAVEHSGLAHSGPGSTAQEAEVSKPPVPSPTELIEMLKQLNAVMGLMSKLHGDDDPPEEHIGFRRTPPSPN